MAQVRVPDIGDFTDVPVIEILVEVGQEVAAEDPLVVLESDKATMELPSPGPGVIESLHVTVGDKLSEGDLVLTLGGAGDGAGPPATAEAPAAPPTPVAAPPVSASDRAEVHAEVLVLGSGPGGYAAAFRAADLGKDVVLVERYASLGGVCLNVGCIPSKALLHVAKVLGEAAELPGVRFGAPELDVGAIRTWKEGIVGKLTGGLAAMAKQRKVRVVHGTGRFTGPHELDVDGTAVSFDQAIVAAGSRAVRLPGIPHDDPRVMDSTGALEIADVPARLLVIGGGIIGLEMATVYDALGSAVTVVELADQLIPGCDRDLVAPLAKRIGGRYAAIHLETTVTSLEARDDGMHATLSSGETEVFDRVLVAVGRAPNGGDLGLEAAGVAVDERGFVAVDERRRTNVAHISAIGDVVRGPMLAHKASHEGHVAAEVIAGEDVVFDPRGIPNVAYTDPEVAWVGLTETDAAADGTPYERAAFPWSASGRGLAVGGATGMTKLLVDPDSRRVLGAGVVGPGAGELVAEVGLALELGADAQDVALTIHAHPTLSETVGLAAAVADGTITDLPNKAARR
ncbi:MAG: dihydrolipoamide dehydrogenase [Solirubrobacteraceae bacterium]|nr:dihydrolipoamide dehydrogenase [Solirubrobacteraceae bacterium]